MIKKLLSSFIPDEIIPGSRNVVFSRDPSFPENPATLAEKVYFLIDSVDDPYLTPWEVKFILDLKHRFGSFRHDHRVVRVSRKEALKISAIVAEILSGAYRHFEEKIRKESKHGTSCPN